MPKKTEKRTKPALQIIAILLGVVCHAHSEADAKMPTFDEVIKSGRSKSAYLKKAVKPALAAAAPEANLADFHAEVGLALKVSCVNCHGPDRQKGDFRVDTLDPNLLEGGDADWWIEVYDVLSNGEMPPDDNEYELADEQRARMIDWLASEIQLASHVRRAEKEHTSFRRMTRYEYNYALQDLLGLSYDFAKDLPPETASEDGFKNSSEMLHLTAMQFDYYRSLGREALKKATVKGERPPEVHYSIKMRDVTDGMELDYAKLLDKGRANPDPRPGKDGKKGPSVQEAKRKFAMRPGSVHFKFLGPDKGSFELLDTEKGLFADRGNRVLHEATDALEEVPPAFQDVVAVIPAPGKLTSTKGIREMKFDLGRTLPDTGILRVRIRAAHTEAAHDRIPTLRLSFGFATGTNSIVIEKLRDLAIGASLDAPQFYQWEIPLSEMRRNPYRKDPEAGGKGTRNPSEFISLANVYPTPSKGGKEGPLPAIQYDWIEITTPVYEQWPPESHTRIFIESESQADETKYAREVLAHFMSRAWRRPVGDAEIEGMMNLFAEFRPRFDDFQDAMVEVLATVIAAPQFLYLVQSDLENEAPGMLRLSDEKLASRLSIFLWSSLPDSELLDLASEGKLSDEAVLGAQVNRMLEDPRAERFSKHFIRQWLGMELLDYLEVDTEEHQQFDPFLKEAMQEETIAFFVEMLRENRSILDFIHTDFAMVNQRLALHYGLPEVQGNHFRKVMLSAENGRGGLLTQAGLLAMNSDGKDSHPLKRGIWLLENLLNDPPPPPPPNVPEIDLADPGIMKLSLKERMEDHRNDPACHSCHAKIDPWGIAFENFDAVGAWRDTIDKEPVDASSLLFNMQELRGMDGLKRFLLENRQDQFARAMVHKMTIYALGRPLSFSDRSSIDAITADLRKKGDGLADMVFLIATSELFQSK